MKKRQTIDRRCRTAVVMLLSLMLTLQTSQAMILCVRSDGRVALEPIVHDRCICESHASHEVAGGVPPGITSWIVDGHCRSCIDIPIPVGPCAGRTARVAAQTDSGGRVAALPLLPAAADATSAPVFESPPVLTSYPTPLCHIVLQV